MEETKAIKLNNVSFSYGDKSEIFENLSFEVKKGENIGIVGANGSGKSTLMKLLVGLLIGDGEIEIGGNRLDKSTLPAIRKSIGYVLQDSDNQLFMPTLYDDIAFGPRNYGLSKDEVEERVDDALRRTEIEHLKMRQNYKLSGGEKRIACIATILAMRPEIVIMDEPSTALDPYNRRNLINLLNRMDETKIIASHDLDLILETCDRVILLGNKGIIADGRVEEILKDKELLESSHLELPLCYQTVIPHRK